MATRVSRSEIAVLSKFVVRKDIKKVKPTNRVDNILFN